jgi:hypothetical protein
MKPARTHTGDDLVVALRGKEDDGRLLGRELVRDADLFPARDDTFLRGLRAGALPAELQSLDVHVIPGENRSADKLLGYSIELQNGTRSFRRHFGLTTLAGVARRGAARLMEQQVLKAGDEYTFYLTTIRPDGDVIDPVDTKPGHDTEQNGVRVTRRSNALVLEPGPLKDYLANSLPLDGASAPLEPEADQPVPIFVRHEVWHEGRELARRGGQNESGAVWTGRLMRDTESPEIFLLLEACLQAEHAQEEKLALTFSGATWARVNELLDVRRRRLNRPHERILGSVHGHNFAPEADSTGNRMCSACAVSKICSRTTAIASLADQDWHQSVFAGQPWAVLLIWGFNAREEDDWRLYGLCDGELQPRTIRLLR